MKSNSIMHDAALISFLGGFNDFEINEGKLNEAEYGTPTGTKTLTSIDAKFDDEVFKKPPHKIDKAWVLKIAKKHKVDPKKAIEWVNQNRAINIKENKLDVAPYHIFKKIEKLKGGALIRFGNEIWIKIGNRKDQWLCGKGPEKGVVSDSTVVAQRVAKSRKSLNIEN